MEHVVSTDRSTRLARGAATVDTVEHALAALFGLGVDDAWLDVWGAEVPALDGSSGPLVRAIVGAGGPRASSVPVAPLDVARPVEVRRDGSRARFEPAAGEDAGLELEVHVEFDATGRQRFASRVDPEVFNRAIAPARTFGFMTEADALRARGRAQGADLECAVVYGPDGVINEGGLRFEDEVARHKALDALGDLALVGARLGGRYVAVRPGHALNVELARALAVGGR